MAKTPEAALKFMDALVPGATARATAEAGDIQALIDSQKAGFKLEPWDWNSMPSRYARRSTTWTNPDQAIFRVNKTREGVFYAAGQLYGITSKERNDIPVYHPDVRVFEVFEADGRPLALFSAILQSAITSAAAPG